jgi:hypothetical protein
MDESNPTEESYEAYPTEAEDPKYERQDSEEDQDAGYYSHTESEQSSHNEFSDVLSDGAGIQPDD